MELGNEKNITKALRWLAYNFPKIENPNHYTHNVQNCINKYCLDAAKRIEDLEEEVDHLTDIVNSYDKLFSKLDINENVIDVLVKLIEILKNNKEKIISVENSDI